MLDPVDFFQSSPPSPEDRLDVIASINPPGGFVALRAERDLHLVEMVDSVGSNPTNDDRCTEIVVKTHASEQVDAPNGLMNGYLDCLHDTPNKYF